MSNKYESYLLKIATHTLVWLLLLIIPYVSTNQVFDSLESKLDLQYVTHCFALSTVLILTFYINYLFLLPKFLLRKRYWLYFLFLALIIIFVLFFCGVLFFYSAFSLQNIIDRNPVVEATIPIIVINAMALWLLSIVTSILWTIHNRLRQTEKEKLSAQIASLKSQINPHFLFNTLNNIYSATISAAPKAANMIYNLSKLMRYTMKDIQMDFVQLEDEINYINNYIELQRLRLDKYVKLDCQIPDDIPPLEIAPMLLIAFVENAFKHGINPEQESHIEIKMETNKTEFQLTVINNKVSVQHDIHEKSGMGIENTRHRLDLVYPSRYLLVINDTDFEFAVSLHINLQ